jgi:hypothetical protein
MKPSGTRDELLTALAELTEQHPEWRLGQMIANLAMAAGRTEASGVWDVEDSEALEAAQRLLERHRQQIA